MILWVDGAELGSASLPARSEVAHVASTSGPSAVAGMSERPLMLHSLSPHGLSFSRPARASFQHGD